MWTLDMRIYNRYNKTNTKVVGIGRYNIEYLNIFYVLIEAEDRIGSLLS